MWSVHETAAGDIVVTSNGAGNLPLSSNLDTVSVIWLTFRYCWAFTVDRNN